ncbi:MAG TPA: carboxylesterase family protein, partial [Phenylobacterium sp.]
TRLGLGDQPTLAGLRAVPADRLIAETLTGEYGPFVDGKLMTRTPAQAFASGHEIDVPLIIGANSGEDSLLGRKLDDPARMVANFAPNRAPYEAEAAKGDEAVVRAAFGDRFMVAPARWYAGQAADGAPAWLYHFSYVGSRFRPFGITTAAHAAEIQYVFEYWGRRTPESAVADDDRAMARLMHGCWVAFAKTGAPTCDAAWPAYDPAKDELAEFGAQNAVRTNFRKPQLDAQQAAALPSLALDAN